MKYRGKIAIISFSTLFLSSLNLKNGLNLYTTDTSIRDIAPLEMKTNDENINIKEQSIKTLATPKNISKAVTTTATSSSKNIISIAGKNILLKPTNCNTMPRPDNVSANYCNFGGSKSLFIYGHNTSSIFGAIKYLKIGSTFKITLNNKTTAYKITKSFTRTVTELNNNSNLRRSIYIGTYLSNSDITIQTCEGKNDSLRRYVKAVRI